MAAALAAEPEGNFVAPRIGVGGGVGGRHLDQGVIRVDLALGGEWKLHDGSALGFDLQFGWLGTGKTEPTWSQVLIGPRLVWSSSFEDGKPFVALSTGPAFTASWDQGAISAAFGAAWQLELAAGFKSIAELFAVGTAGLDTIGFSGSVVGGARLNLGLVLKAFQWVASLFDARHRVPPPSDAEYK